MRRVVLFVSAAAALATAMVHTQYRADLSTARQRLLAGSQLAQTACGPVEYTAVGSGPAVLVIHGAGGGYSQAQRFTQALADAGFTAIAMSRFGYLRTPLPADGSPAAQADAHGCLLDALAIPAAAVFGASAGAPSALQFCLRHAQRCTALVLLVPAIAIPGRRVETTTPPSPFWQFVFDYVLRSDFVIWSVTRMAPSMLVETVLATPLDQFRAADPAEQRRGMELIRDIFPVSLRAEGLRNDALLTTSSPVHDLERITAPALLISVRDDLYGTDEGATYAAGRIPGARLKLFASGGHAWLGHDAQVREALVAFLMQRAGPSAAQDP